MHEVLARLEREVAADRAGRGLAWVRRSHEQAHHLPGVRTTLDHHRDERAPGDERDEIAEERLVAVLLVVPARELLVDLAQLERDDREPLALEATDDLADEAALDGIGLAEDEGSGAHGRRRLLATPPIVRLRGTPTGQHRRRTGTP